MEDQSRAKEQLVVQETHAGDDEVFELQITAVAHPIELFELNFPRPPQGTWREKFDIRVDARFASMDVKLENVTVRVAARGARLTTACKGCSLLPHSLYGSLPLSSHSLLAVQETVTQQVAASGSAQVQAKVGVLQGFDGNASVEAKASGEASRHIAKQGTREESVSRVVPRPHGSWDISEPHGLGVLSGDYLTSRGQ